MTVGIVVTGLNQVIKNLEQLGRPDIYNDTLKQTAENALKYAKMYAPVDTGLMEDDIQVHMDTRSFILACNVPWAVFNEYGTIYMKAGAPNSPLGVISTSGKYAFRPFMRPAAIRAMGEMPEIFGEKLYRLWK